MASAVLAGPLDQPAPERLAEARRIVQEMAADPRGPYSRIRWYCNDGTVQPPVAYACRERGGGRQHAEYSDRRRRLAELGYAVGTIFAALSYEELVASQPRRQRLRELALERYLIDIDNGWVLRRARGYRGRVQVEDEETVGRELLLELLSDERWSLDNFLLVRESARVIPHGLDTGLARSVRRTVVEIAEMDASAEALRAEIHGSPDAGTAARLRRWLDGPRSQEVRALGERLAADLDLLYGAAGRRERLQQALTRLRPSAAAVAWRREVESALDAEPRARLSGLCASLARARFEVFSRVSAAERLALVDAMQGVETEVQLAFGELPPERELARRDLLRTASDLLRCAYGSGLLSATELEAVAADTESPPATMPLAEYRSLVGRLKRVPGWAVGTIRHTFAEPLTRYTALDPRAARFADDLLRGSPFWLFGDMLKIAARDADRLAGSVVEIDGRPIGTAVALNGGLAIGPLRLLESLDGVEAARLEPGDIVALPETIAELPRIAGILTLGEGNALSHVQLLARNFGIPNVAVDYETLDLLRPLAGTEVVLAVGSDGTVVLRRMDPTVQGAMGRSDTRPTETPAAIELPTPDLRAEAILRLHAIHRGLSGRVIGPKAANLGELNRVFPGRVAPAVAIPFGVYAAHLGQAGLTDRIASAFARRESGEASAAELAAELDAVRREIAALGLLPGTERALRAAMQAEFGEPGSYGLFVRSDTNVEDLPQFTGAGLNETIPNVVGIDAQLAAIPRVWSSVLSPRAIAWRAGVLSDPGRIYASVLLMKSVPATKSGVLVTRNLLSDGPGLTASAAWGVGGAVAGEAAESLVIRGQSVEIVSEAKAPFQRRIDPAGGVELVPAPAGAVLSEEEIDRLRELAEEVLRKYEPARDESGVGRPWDIEFGFVDGELTLFQIRPLVERGNGRADAMLRALRPPAAASAAASDRVVLDDRPLGESE